MWDPVLDTSVQCLADSGILALVLFESLLEDLHQLFLAIAMVLGDSLQPPIVALEFLDSEFQKFVHTIGFNDLVVLSCMVLAGRLALASVCCPATLLESYE